MIPAQLLLQQDRSENLNRDRIFFQYPVVKLFLIHFTRVDQLSLQCIDLQCPDHVGNLIQRTVAARD